MEREEKLEEKVHPGIHKEISKMAKKPFQKHSHSYHHHTKDHGSHEIEAAMHHEKAPHKYGHHSPVPNVVHGHYRPASHEAHTSDYEVSKSKMAHDGSMIAEDHGAPCLLPQHVIEREWSGIHKGYETSPINDLFTSVQEQIHEESGEIHKETKPQKV
jgi:hypothetical protein